MTRSLKLLTVAYSYRSPSPQQRHDSYGEFYLFGEWGSWETRAFLINLFCERHGNAKLLEFTLKNQQP